MGYREVDFQKSFLCPKPWGYQTRVEWKLDGRGLAKKRDMPGLSSSTFPNYQPNSLQKVIQQSWLRSSLFPPHCQAPQLPTYSCGRGCSGVSPGLSLTCRSSSLKRCSWDSSCLLWSSRICMRVSRRLLCCRRIRASARSSSLQWSCVASAVPSAKAGASAASSCCHFRRLSSPRRILPMTKKPRPMAPMRGWLSRSQMTPLF